MSPANRAGPFNPVPTRRFCLLLAFIPSLLAAAGTFPTLEISEQSGNYRIRMAALIHAPAQFVFEVLTDYRHIYRLNPAITQSAILPSPHEGTVRVRTRMEGCILFFCRDIDRVEEVREVGGGHLQTVIIPEYSDFTSGSADWRIHPLGNYSRIVYEAQVTPAFFIPPVIGSYFVKRALGEAVRTSFVRLECVARIRAGMSIPARSYLVNGPSDPADLQEMRAELLAGEDPVTRVEPPSAGPNRAPRLVECSGPCDSAEGGC
jgi:hypothetical protein